MDEQTLRRVVKDVVDEAIAPLGNDIRDLKTDVSTLKDDVSTLKVDVSTLKDDVSTLKDDVSTLKVDVSTLKGSVVTLEQTVGVYADSYKQNQRNIEKLGKRLATVEDTLDIKPPEEHKIHYSTSELI